MADQTDFQLSTLAYLYQFLANGKTAELEALGLDVEDMRLIRQLSVGEVPRSRRGVKVIKRIEIDHEQLSDVLQQTRRARKEAKTIDRLIEAGAPHRMLSHFFGITKQEASNRRKLLNVQLSSGRPVARHPSDKPTEDLVLIDLVREHMRCHAREHRTRSTNQCDALLQTAKYTDLPVSAIWDAVDEAEGRGEFAWHE